MTVTTTSSPADPAAPCRSHQSLQRRRRLYRRPLHADRRSRDPHHGLGIPALRRHLRCRGVWEGSLLPARRPHRAVPRLHAEVPLRAQGERRRYPGRAAPLRGAERPAERLRRDGLPARTAGTRDALSSGPCPQLHHGLRDPLGVGGEPRRAGARRPSRHRRDAAHPGRRRRPDGQELSLGRPHARPVRGTRSRRRLLPPARPRGQCHGRPGLQRLLRHRRPRRDAGCRRARRHHAPLCLRALRRPGPRLGGAAGLGRGSAERRRDLPVHHGRRRDAGGPDRWPHHGQRPARPGLDRDPGGLLVAAARRLACHAGRLWAAARDA